MCVREVLLRAVFILLYTPTNLDLPDLSYIATNLDLLFSGLLLDSDQTHSSLYFHELGQRQESLLRARPQSEVSGVIRGHFSISNALEWILRPLRSFWDSFSALPPIAYLSQNGVSSILLYTLGDKVFSILT